MIAEEAEGARPFYRPGDIVTNIHGDKGVIVEAKVIIDGGVYQWTEEVPSLFESAWQPNYAVVWVTDSKGGQNWVSAKYAWWYAHEWVDVELGIAHPKQEKEK